MVKTSLNFLGLKRKLAQLAVVVRDYDEAIKFYTEKLAFHVVEDTAISSLKRWVVLSPSRESECCILLAKASNEKQHASIGNQTGGRVFLFLFTEDLDTEYRNMKELGVKFVREPERQEHGFVAVFEDLYGNLWDLIEPTEQNLAYNRIRKMKKL